MRTNEDGNGEREITRNSMKEIFRQNRTGTLVEVMMNSCVPMLNKSPPPPQPIPEESNLSHYNTAGLNLTNKTAIMKKDKSDSYCHWLTSIVLLIPVTFKLTIKMYRESIHQKLPATWPFSITTWITNLTTCSYLPHVAGCGQLQKLLVLLKENVKSDLNSFYNYPP